MASHGSTRRKRASRGASSSESEYESRNSADDEVDGAEESDEEISQEERNNIRGKLTNMNFEELQKLKQEMGLKLYNRTVNVDLGSSKRKTIFKRANKNRPREMSSKKRVKLDNNVAGTKKQQQKPRDPRFDPLCGSFDGKIFKSNYKFVNNIRKKEKNILEEQLKDASDEGEAKKLKYVVQRLGNQIREQEKKEIQDREVFEQKREIKDKLRKGDKPQFKKKSVKRVEDLIKKYEELKKTNKLQKHIEKRSKKLSVKERRKLEKQNLDL